MARLRFASGHASAVTLTRCGVGVQLPGLTFALVSGTTYSIGGLGALTLGQGTFVLSLDGTKIADLAGNVCTGSKSTSWLLDTTPPSSTVNPLP